MTFSAGARSQMGTGILECTSSAACSPGLSPQHDTLQVHAPSWLQTYWSVCASSGASLTCQPTPT